MNKSEIARWIYGTSHITGRFKLRSGQLSKEYFDKYLFEAEPKLLAEIAGFMLPLIPPWIDILAGLEMGGIPVASALSLYSGVPAAFVRKKAKEYGTCKLAEGPDVKDKNVCIVEDIVTTGGQIIESARELRKRGAKIDAAMCVILRDEKAVSLLAAEGLTLIPAFTMDYIKEQSLR